MNSKIAISSSLKFIVQLGEHHVAIIRITEDNESFIAVSNSFLRAKENEWRFFFAKFRKPASETVTGLISLEVDLRTHGIRSITEL